MTVMLVHLLVIFSSLVMLVTVKPYMLLAGAATAVALHLMRPPSVLMITQSMRVQQQLLGIRACSFLLLRNSQPVPAVPPKNSRCNPALVAQIAKQCNRQFTLDACANKKGSNRVAQYWCASDQQFMRSNCENHHTWIAPPVSQLPEYINHYLHRKQLSPATTSACILVPKLRRSNFKSLLKHMQLLQQYPAGTCLYITPDGRDWHATCTYQVYYDPPATLHATYALHEDSDEIVLTGTAGSPLLFDSQISGSAGRIKVDTGASHNFLRANFVQAAGIAITPSTHNIELADGTLVQAVGTCKARVRIGRSNDILSFYVLNLSAEYDALLGEAWLKQRGATLDFATGCLILKKGTATLTVPSTSAQGRGRQSGGGSHALTLPRYR